MLGARVLGPSAVLARWRLGDGAVLAIAVNLGDSVVALAHPTRGPVVETRAGALVRHGLGAHATAVFIEEPA